MQLKLYKKSTVLLTLTLIFDIIAIALLYIYRDLWASHKMITIFLFALLLMLVYGLFSYYDLNADRNYIRKCVSNGDVALAKITDGTFVRFARDAKLKNHVFWKLNVEIYDNDMKMIKTTIIDKFSTHQTKIPAGYVYVTYLEDKPEDSLIIPNVIISSIEPYKELTDDYEKALKPKYLNAYYNNGLIVETYKESMAYEKKLKDLDEQYK
ncbi:MAG: hypothetical protein Q4D13_06520 [Erysipelotrichaceae bacterium]|nr:hypothetical protein [Erysipelotrichaceae bacterium]